MRFVYKKQSQLLLLMKSKEVMDQHYKCHAVMQNITVSSLYTSSRTSNGFLLFFCILFLMP